MRPKRHIRKRYRESYFEIIRPNGGKSRNENLTETVMNSKISSYTVTNSKSISRTVTNSKFEIQKNLQREEKNG